QHSASRQRRKEAFPLRHNWIKVRTHVCPQQFFARFVPKHPYHRVVHIQKSPFWRSEEQSFLNAVEQLAIPPLGFAPVGHILQNVNGSRVIVRNSWLPLRRNQKKTLRRLDDIF